MFDIKTVEIELGGKTLKLETGRVARQADGAVLATLGETVVLCAVTAAKSVKPGQDFFPLTVHYQEKFSAAGRIPGGFFKRERGATEKETLTSRLIDRPVRPLFPEGFYNEVLCRLDRLCGGDGAKHNGFAEGRENRAVGLAGNAARFELQRLSADLGFNSFDIEHFVTFPQRADAGWGQLRELSGSLGPGR